MPKKENKVCATAGCTSKAFTYELDAAGDCCNKCGAVQPNSTEFEVLGRVLEADAMGGVEGHAGRNYIRVEDQNLESSDPTLMNEAGANYHKQKEAEIEMLLKRILTNMNASQLYPRVKRLFYDSKRLGKFKWGDRSNVMAHACVYIVARQVNKPVTINEIACISEVDIYALNRAQMFIKDWNVITITDVDPFVYVERLITHTTELLKKPNPPHSGSENGAKFFTPANLKFLRALKMPAVRKLAATLLAITNDIDLMCGRAPQQVACALVVTAMEGVARVVVPFLTQIFDEFSDFLLVRTFTVEERYHELYAMLAKYGPLIPWLKVELKGKGRGRKDLAKHVEDIVTFTKVDKKKLAQERKEALGKETSSISRKGKRKVKLASDEEEEAQETDEDKNSEEEEGIKVKPIDEKALKIMSSARAACARRPEEFMRIRPGANKRVKTIKQVAAAVFLPFDSSASASSLHAPIPCPIDGHDNAILRHRSGQETFAPHSDETVKFRQQLLAGIDPHEVNTAVVQFDPDDIFTPRLTQLLWTKTESEITDKELFDEETNEYEANFRTDAEVEILRPEIEALIEKPHTEKKKAPRRKYVGRQARNIEGDFIDVYDTGEDRPERKKAKKGRINHKALKAILASTGEFDGVAGVTQGLGEEHLFGRYAVAEETGGVVEEDGDEDDEDEVMEEEVGDTSDDPWLKKRKKDDYEEEYDPYEEA